MAEYPNMMNLLTGQLHADPATTDTTKFGLYAVGTEQLYLPGIRYHTDERAFVYGLVGGDEEVSPGHGAAFGLPYLDVDAGLQAAVAIGDTSVYITLDAGTATAFGTADRMVGGYYSNPAGTDAQFRRIIGHGTGTSGSVIRIDLDGPATLASDAAAFIELMQNPWWEMRRTRVGLYCGYTSFGGVPVTTIPVSSYGWFQTWGPCWVTPNLPVSDAADRRMACFRADGSIGSFEDNTVEEGNQIAGFVIDSTKGTGEGADNPPFVFLQISR